MEWNGVDWRKKINEDVTELENLSGEGEESEEAERRILDHVDE